MYKNLTKIACTIALTIATTVSNAMAQTTDSVSLSVEEAIEIAISENATIKIANTEIERQQYVRKETVGHLLPNLSATGSYNYNIQLPVMFMPEGVFGPGTGGATRMGYSNSFTGTAALSLPLFAPALYTTLQLNKQQMFEAVEKARSSKIDLANSVRQAYYGVLLAQSSLELIKENIDLAQEVVDDSQKAFNQGVVSEYDLITSQVQLSNLTPTLYESQGALHNAKLMLNMLLGLPLQTVVTPKEELTDFSEYINQNNQHIIDLTANAQLNLVDIQQNLLSKQLKLQKTARIPTLAAFGQYQVLTQNNTLNIGSYDWNGFSLVGLQLEIPIFSGMSNIQKEKQIKNQQQQLEQQREYLLESLSVEAQTAITDIRTAKQQMQANTTAKLQAQKGYKIAVTRYETGAGTIVEVNSAQVQLMQADMNYRSAIYSYMVAQANFDKIIGTGF